ncbi:hypothetical protein [Sphingomonas sp.]|uniref:hypothetical protein n=1 Tax=Sphingomonas sp. TaxID=28214 RepID=UPI003CC6002B
MPLVLLAAAAAAVPMPEGLPLRMAVAARCESVACDAPQRSRYRLDPQITDATTLKAQALDATGRPCPLMGPTICPHRERIVYTTGFGR